MSFLDDTRKILKKIDLAEVAAVTEIVKSSRRVFTVGNGGGAAHASHFAADLRQMAGKEAYCVNDNVAAVSAAENDFGWGAGYRRYLETSHLRRGDLLFVFSVGGGSVDGKSRAVDGPQKVSENLNSAVAYAGYQAMIDAEWAVAAKVAGIVGKDGGFLRKLADASILIPSDSTPQIEGIQSVLAHMVACS